MSRPSIPRRSSRAPAAVLALAGMLGTLTACGSDDSESGGGDGPLEVWTRSADAPAATYERVFEAFTEQTGIEVDYQPVVEFDTQIQGRAASRDLPDVFINDSGSLGTYQSQGWLLPVDREAIAGQDGIADTNWDITRGVDGEFYGVPFSRQAFVTVVRKDWREAVGMDVPQTWEDLTALADAFATQDPDGNGNDDTFGMVIPGSTERGYLSWWASSYIWQAGGDFLTEAGEGRYESAFDSPETVQAVEWIREQFCTPGHVQPGALTSTTLEARHFNNGEAGIYLTGPYNFAAYDEAPGTDTFEVIPTPAGPAGSTTLAEGENIYFGAGSDKEDQQRQLAEFLISPEAQEIAMAVEGGSEPVVRLPVTTELQAGEVRQDERWDLVQEQYDTDVRTFPSAIDFTPVRQATAEGLNEIMSDCGGDIAAGVAQIDEDITAELEAQDLLP
ncbi:ABC transporter substrate-binding protein [Streptomyces sp. SBT349]|uniref:ABC transporter substrate-binding protein n=1 Tax=Streptomyces sp. SBT349 TaxID=1580539 RepID=UPI0007C6E82F|nr:sugar ABC transporter substrate-binding protein [Streptomyces sp. SBT349]